MLQLKCDVCGEPATIHETTVQDGSAASRHLCQEHGIAAVPVVKLRPDALQHAEERLRDLSEAEKENLILLQRASRRG
jgi:hypothetical protein